MAYELPLSISLDRLELLCHRIASGAEARGLTDLAARFDDLYLQTKAEVDARKTAALKVNRSEAHLDVRLADAHSTVGALSSRAFQIAGKKSKREPYKNVFGTHRAKVVQGWGADRSVEFIRDAGAKLQDFPQLADETAAMTAAGEELFAADQHRDEAEREASRFEFVRARRRDVVKAAMDDAQVEILSRFPGRQDLVRAILNPANLIAARKKTAARKAAAKKAEAAKDCDLTSKDQSPQ